jgi:hypothetical protein
MANPNSNNTRMYFVLFGAYWFVFGLITIFYPKLMDLFQTDEGIMSKTAFSDHVWMHGGLDIVSLCVMVFALSRETVSKNIVRATALAALMPTAAITYSLVATSYWNPMFMVAGAGCLAFAVWGFMISAKM